MRPRIPRRFRRLVAVITASVMLGLLVGFPAQASQYVIIDGEGSTWAGPAWHQWEADAAADGVTFNYTPNGSSAGRDDFARQTSAMFADSEIPFRGDADDPQDQTYPNFNYSMLPVVAGGTAFGYNLPIGGSSNYPSLQLNMATIAGIFSGEITNWDAPQIRATNPGVALPNQQITVVVRSDGSGATAQFKLWMLRQFPADYRHLAAETGGNPNAASSYYPVGSLGACASNTPCFVAQSGSDGVTTFVQHTPYTIDYDEYAYDLTAGLPVARVENAAGFFTLPNQYAVAVALIAAQIDMDKNSPNYLSQNLSNVYGYRDPRAYPMSMYTYEMIPDQTTQVLQDPQGATLAWVSTNAVCEWQADMGALGYSPLPMNLVLASMQQIEKIPGINAAVTATITDTQKGVSSGTVNPCNSPTFKPGQSPDDNVLVQTAPFPPGCDAACQAPWIGKDTDQGPGGGGNGGGHNGGGGGNGGGHGGGNGGGRGGGGGGNGNGGGGNGGGGNGAGGNGGGNGKGAGGSAGSSCNAATGICTSGSSSPGSGNLASNSAGTGGSGDVATAIPAAAGWASPQTLGIIVVILLVGVLVVPPVVASYTGRRGRRG
jgi:phosphate transport system substrate-binding protein